MDSCFFLAEAIEAAGSKASCCGSESARARDFGDSVYAAGLDDELFAGVVAFGREGFRAFCRAACFCPAVSSSPAAALRSSKLASTLRGSLVTILPPGWAMRRTGSGGGPFAASCAKRAARAAAFARSASRKLPSKEMLCGI